MASGGERDLSKDLGLDPDTSSNTSSDHDTSSDNTLPDNETSCDNTEMVVFLNTESDVAPPPESVGISPPTYDDAVRKTLSEREPEADEAQGRGIGGSIGDIETDLDKVEISEEEQINLLAKFNNLLAYQGNGPLPPPIAQGEETDGSAQGRGIGGSPGDIETDLDKVEISEEEQINLLAKFNNLLAYQGNGPLPPAPIAQGEETDEGSTAGASAARPPRQWSVQDTQTHNGGEDIEMESFLADDATATDEARPGDVELTMINDDDDDDNGGFEPRNVDASQADTMQVRGIETVEYGTSSERSREYDWECPVNIPVVSFMVNQIVRGLQRGKDALPGMSSTKKLMICLIILLVIGGILLVTLLPASFVYIEYHEYGLVRNKWTGAIDYDEVHEFGCHLMRPQDEILRLQSTAHHVSKTLEVPTDTGLVIGLQINLQYFLNKQEIPLLLKDYYLDYRGVIESLVISSIKNLGINFSLDSYRLKRKEVEAAFAERVRDVLEGHHMKFREFQLGRVIIPEAVMERYTRRLLLQIYAEREYFLQDRSVEVKKTEKEVKEIENRAREVRELATAEALVTSKIAEAEADMNIQLAYQQAMTTMFARLNVTKEEHKLSFMFVKTLEDVRGNNNLFSYGYSKNTAFTP